MDRAKLSPFIRQIFGDRELIIIERALLRLAPDINKFNLINKSFDLNSEDGLLKFKRASFYVDKYNIVFLLDFEVE